MTEVVPAQLRACARAAAEVATVLGGLTLGSPADQAARWLPGARAAGVASTLGDAWTTRSRLLASDVDTHAQRLTAAADRYAGADAAAAGVLGRTGR